MGVFYSIWIQLSFKRLVELLFPFNKHVENMTYHLLAHPYLMEIQNTVCSFAPTATTAVITSYTDIWKLFLSFWLAKKKNSHTRMMAPFISPLINQVNLSATLEKWIKAQKLKAPAMKNTSTFYRNLEEALDARRRDHGLLTLKPNNSKDGEIVDFSSNDTLSLGASGALRAEFTKELERHPDIPPGAGSSRVMDGNYEYLETVEDEIAKFHGAESGLITGSGFEANLAIFAAIPRPGDVIVYDELVHASTHDGMQQSMVLTRVPFRHNDVDSFRDTLTSVCDSHSLIRQGKRCVIIAVESFYSMDGDICPLQEFIEAAKEVFPGGNAQFLIDEAHSTGVIGPNGAGLVCELGLEREVAIRLHTFGKALSASGGIDNALADPHQVHIILI